MREQLQQQERREALQRQTHGHGMPVPSGQNMAGLQSMSHSAPSAGACQPAQHQQILKIQNDIRLENPTSFHVLQTQSQPSQMAQSHGQQQQSPLQSQQPQSPLSHALNGPQSPFPLSPDSPLSCPPSSASEFDDGIWDVINTLHLNDPQTVTHGINDPNASAIAATLPADVGFLYSPSHIPVQESPPSSLPTASNVKLSSSCPVSAPLNEDVHAWKKERQKKDNHNKIERRRRYNINDRIQELGTLLPRGDPRYVHITRDMKYNKGTILRASVDYVKCLKNEVDKLPEVEKRYRDLEDENRRMNMRIQQLEQQVKMASTALNIKQETPDQQTSLCEHNNQQQHIHQLQSMQDTLQHLPMVTEVKTETPPESEASHSLVLTHDSLMTHKIANTGCWTNWSQGLM